MTRMRSSFSPSPSEYATPRTFRGRVAVSTLTSGQQPEVIMENKTCGTSGNRTPRRGKIQKNLACLSCRVRVRCHNVARGKIIITYNHRGERWSRTTEGRNESQSKVTANTTGARHSRAASSRRGAGKHSNGEMKKNVWGAPPVATN